MDQKIIQFNLDQRKAEMPDFQSGDVVKVYRKIQEAGKERIQVFEGMIIAIKGRQSSSPTITVRKVSDGVGVELIIPLYSPMVDKIELVKRAKVRRSKLYYVREKAAKSLRFKFKDIASILSGKKEEAVVEDPKVEEAKAEEPKVEEVKEEVKAEETKTEEKK